VREKPVFQIDGDRFSSLEEFFDEVGAALSTAAWGRNLDAFNDVLRGGFGTPEGGFILRWLHSSRSRDALGYRATVDYLERKLQRCHPANIPMVTSELEAARRGEGQTVFDILVEIIRIHGPGGDEAEDGVEIVPA
jgi:RNAse (barnase) inhibitor barstar